MVNIIIPTYKAKSTLPKTLDSLVAQTKPNFWVTIVQDCDGEDYSEIIDTYRQRGLHISLLSTPQNGGPGVARQVGIDASSRFEYIMFSDADDMYSPFAVDTLTREASVNGADIVMSTANAEQLYGPNYQLLSFNTPVQWCGGKIYRTSYLKSKNIRFRDDLRLNEDAYFNLVAFNSTEKRFKIAEETYLWRYNRESLTRKESNDAFFHKSWDQYIASQAYGLQKLYEINDEVPHTLTAATVLNIYDHFMRAIHLKENLELANPYFQVIASLQPLWDAFENRDVWKYLYEHLKVGVLEKEQIYFYQMRFIDWLNVIKGFKPDEN